MDLKEKYWKETYQRNIKKMIGICFRYVSERQIAEDLAHDAFMTAMFKADTFNGTGHFDAWLRKITVNTALMYLRDIKNKNEKEKEIFQQDLTSNDEDENMRQDFTTHELLEAIDQLPKHHQLVFNLYVIDNYSHKEIAEELLISEGTSKSHLARARKKLQQILNEKEQVQKRPLIFLLFPLRSGNIDQVFKRTFAGYEIETNKPEFFNDLVWENLKLPKINVVYTLTFKVWSLVVIAIFTGTIIFLFNNNMGHNDMQEQLPLSVDTVFHLNNDKTIKLSSESSFPDHLKNNNLDFEEQNILLSTDSSLNQNKTDTIKKFKKNTPQKNNVSKTKPVVVKRKRPIHKNVIVRDTLTILDTNHEK